MDWNIVSRIDWGIALTAIGLIASITIAVYQLRNLIPRTRSTIKIDLEILKLLDPKDPNYPYVKFRIDENIRSTYGIKVFKVYSKHYFIGGIICSIVFAVLTLYLARYGFLWRALITAFLALAAIGAIQTGLEKPSAKPSNPPL